MVNVMYNIVKQVLIIVYMYFSDVLYITVW